MHIFSYLKSRIKYLITQHYLYLDLSLKMLKANSGCTGAAQVIEWVKGCFHALEKKYVS